MGLHCHHCIASVTIIQFRWFRPNPKAVLVILAVRATPICSAPMAQAIWHDDDIYTLTPPEVVTVKKNVARALGFRYADCNPQATCALETAGVKPLDAASMTLTVNKYVFQRSTPPIIINEDYFMQLLDKSKVATVINCNMLDWTNNGMPWNKGHIDFWFKGFKNGEKQWDTSIERFAGGIPLSKNMEFSDLNFSLSSQSSVQSLVRDTVGEVQRGEDIPRWQRVAYQSLRVTWLFESSMDEIVNIKVMENIEQHERLRHHEALNIFQVETWIAGMQTTKGRLDPTKPLDVFKYALLLGNPKAPLTVPEWMRKELGLKPATFANKLDVLTKKECTTQMLQLKQASTTHAEMKQYKAIAMRVKAIKGFKYYKKLYSEVCEKMGQGGLGHMMFPISGAILLDSAILTTEAFSDAERRSLPVYRDGALGDLLQLSMVSVAVTRAFEYGYVSEKAVKPLFGTATHWVALGRFMPHIEKIIQQIGGNVDSAGSLLRAIWTGEHDTELANICGVLPGTLDLDPEILRTRLAEVFSPFHQLQWTVATESQKAAFDQTKKPEDDEMVAMAVDKKKDELLNGDVTDTLCDKEMHAAQKIKLCDTLNKEAQKKREAAIARMVMTAALHILRLRTHTFHEFADAKRWMEANKDGFRCRIVHLDATQHADFQTRGDTAKHLCHQPSAAQQEALAKGIKQLPMTPITGGVLSRTGGRNISLNDLWAELTNFKYPRSIFVPIEMSPAWLRIIKSAARRSLGPAVDLRERSGVEFELRSVGGMAHSPPVDDSQDAPVSDAEEEEQEDCAESLEDVDPMELENISESAVKRKFGAHAFQVLGSLFQHTSKIAESGRFLNTQDFLHLVNENGKKLIYRRGQLHESVVYSAIKSSLAVSAVPITRQDTFVQVCGGTPEPLVAAILAGFHHVIFMGTHREVSMMQVPSEDEAASADFDKYVSPDPSEPTQGALAVTAAKTLSVYIRNCIFETRGELMVPPPFEIAVPPLTKYWYQAITGRVHVKTVEVESAKPEATVEATTPVKSSAASSLSSPAAPASSAKNGPGSASGKKAPPAPKGLDVAEQTDEEKSTGSDGESSNASGEKDPMAVLDEIEAHEKKGKGGRPKKKAKKGQ